MSTETLWSYPEDVLHVLARHLPYPTLGILTRINTLFNRILTPHLYHTMLIDDKHRGPRLRRALKSPSAIHTRILYVDGGHSCDECHAAGAPTLSNLKRVILSFDRGASLHKDSVWPDDPCRTLSRVRPDVIVIRVRNHLVHDVYPFLRHHMPAAIYEKAEIVVSTLITDHPYRAPSQTGWNGRATQILLPGPSLDAAWQRLDSLAIQVASNSNDNSNSELTLVGVEAYPRSKRQETLTDKDVSEVSEEEYVQEAQDGEDAFWTEVERQVKILAVEMEPDPVERMVDEHVAGLRLVTLGQYLHQREWIGEVPPNIASEVLHQYYSSTVVQ